MILNSFLTLPILQFFFGLDKLIIHFDHFLHHLDLQHNILGCYFLHLLQFLNHALAEGTILQYNMIRCTLDFNLIFGLTFKFLFLDFLSTSFPLSLNLVQSLHELAGQILQLLLVGAEHFVGG